MSVAATACTTQFTKENEDLLFRANLYTDLHQIGFPLKKAKYIGPYAIEWKQRNMSKWYYLKLGSTTKTYYVYAFATGQKKGGVIKVFVAEESLLNHDPAEIPEKIPLKALMDSNEYNPNEDEKSQVKKFFDAFTNDSALHFGYNSWTAKSTGIFFVIHPNSWGPHQKRFAKICDQTDKIIQSAVLRMLNLDSPKKLDDKNSKFEIDGEVLEAYNDNFTKIPIPMNASGFSDIVNNAMVKNEVGAEIFMDKVKVGELVTENLVDGELVKTVTDNMVWDNAALKEGSMAWLDGLYMVAGTGGTAVATFLPAAAASALVKDVLSRFAGNYLRYIGNMDQETSSKELQDDPKVDEQGKEDKKDDLVQDVKTKMKENTKNELLFTPQNYMKLVNQQIYEDLKLVEYEKTTKDEKKTEIVITKNEGTKYYILYVAGKAKGKAFPLFVDVEAVKDGDEFDSLNMLHEEVENLLPKGVIPMKTIMDNAENQLSTDLRTEKNTNIEISDAPNCSLTFGFSSRDGKNTGELYFAITKGDPKKIDQKNFQPGCAKAFEMINGDFKKPKPDFAIPENSWYFLFSDGQTTKVREKKDKTAKNKFRLDSEYDSYAATRFASNFARDLIYGYSLGYLDVNDKMNFVHWDGAFTGQAPKLDAQMRKKSIDISQYEREQRARDTRYVGRPDLGPEQTTRSAIPSYASDDRSATTKERIAALEDTMVDVTESLSHIEESMNEHVAHTRYKNQRFQQAKIDIARRSSNSGATPRGPPTRRTTRDPKTGKLNYFV
mmetsp:Transcript_29948/g.44278  ORF Transcript_29948/g.44278 Transcript_29948/m.44278 type:complete len:776 (+) Transcript_29948:118-2445(+)